MKKLIIIGAGGFGREVLEYVKDMKLSETNYGWDVLGFIDDNMHALEGYNCGYKVLETIEKHQVSLDNVYICAIGDTKIKLDICQKFVSLGAEFINVIHPTARIGRECVIGNGNVICPNACLTVNVTVGDFNFINCNANCGHDSKIGNGCTISPFCDITGYVNIENGVFLGSHASICPSVRVGQNTKIGAGATVINDIPSNCTAVGTPAKVINKK